MALLAGPYLLFILRVVRADPVIDTCYNTGCNIVVSLLAPCGGGVTNASLQQDLIYTPTASLGGCECNTYFYNSLSSCLSCIASQGNNNPQIQDQQDWVNNCLSYGYNFTDTPVVNSTSSSNTINSGGGGLSKGAIAGIVVGCIVLIVLAIAGTWFCLKGRRGKQSEAEVYEKSGTTGVAVEAHDSEYPASYDHQDNYYSTQTNYQDLSAQHAQDQPFSLQHDGFTAESDDYYGTNAHNAMMMQDFDHDGEQDSSYVPPPPHPASTSSTATVAGGTAAYSDVPRPLESLPQSLRNRPKGWEHQHDFSSDLPANHTLQSDKAEFDEGEDLEPPRSRNQYVNDEYIPRRSMTPTRANMQSYRDEFSRPSFEREPRRSGSDRGSISGINMVRGVESGSNNLTNYDHPNDDPYTVGLVQDSPESARRRARAAELFSAESSRR
ncbi:hypothetical protein BGZ49_007705 [Haplosporangium sp. Z 27]|nr:hypothetical protein BGZ49_007705 [Haplosporangium sp. Z 27]